MQIVQPSSEPPINTLISGLSKWDLPWLGPYAPGIPFSITYPDLPVSSLLEDTGRRWGNRTGAICFESKLTFSDLLAKAHQFAHGLSDWA